jgi:hypothetical protein
MSITIDGEKEKVLDLPRDAGVVQWRNAFETSIALICFGQLMDLAALVMDYLVPYFVTNVPNSIKYDSYHCIQRPGGYLRPAVYRVTTLQKMRRKKKNDSYGHCRIDILLIVQPFNIASPEMEDVRLGIDMCNPPTNIGNFFCSSIFFFLH